MLSFRKTHFIRFMIAMALAPVGTFAQQKPLTAAQLFRNEKTDLLQPLPLVREWIDDTHYALYRAGTTVSVDAKTGQETPYTKPQPSPPSYKLPAEARNATASPDGKWLAYTKNRDLYVQELATGTEKRLTSDATDVIYNGYAAWLYWEEILGRASNYKAFWWSPDSKKLAFMRFDETKVPVFPIAGATGTHGYLESQRYPKSGDPNPLVKMGFVQMDTPANITWADFDPQADHYFGTPFWTPDGSALWMQWKARGQDHLKLYAVNPATGAKTEVYDEQQKTWVDWLTDVDFLKDGKHFVVLSDRDGWRHAYRYTLDGKLVNQITKGEFTVTTLPLIDEKSQSLYFVARKENSARMDLYKIKFDGKNLQRLTFGDFSHQVTVSPGGSYFTTTYSNVQTPPKSALLDKNGKLIRELGDAKGTGFGTYALAKTELVRVPTPDGFALPMTITYPAGFDPARKYPVWISIYGGPNAGTVYDTWKPVGPNQWYAQEGLIQVAVDHRASGHFGKVGQNFMHRNLGKWELNDYIEAVKWLRAKPFVDAGKIGITGGSYGGYVTALALTRGAEYFTHGIANFGVMDWRLYDSEYTERFMDTPAENPEGYRESAVLEYADRLKGTLRIVHGTMDDNVHMQNSVQLVDKLEELGKHFEFMIYPGARHGFGNKGKHAQMETARFIYRYLLEKPFPAEVFQ
jgi:dipeptidyl-peptidase-4